MISHTIKIWIYSQKNNNEGFAKIDFDDDPKPA